MITFVLICNALIGYFQEIKAQKSLEKLETYLTIQAKVLRDKELSQISADELVPGDIVILDPGSKIPADLRIIESVDLRVDESSLTGESLPTGKLTKKCNQDTPLTDRHNMAYSGTFVTSGRGRGVVVTTGAETEFGKIASSLQHANPPDSLLQRELKTLSKQLIYIILATMIVLLIIGVIRKIDAHN